TFADFGPTGPSPEDILIATSDIYYASQGEMQGMIFDYTESNRFELFRRESGAFRWFKDFNVYPSKRFFKGHADVFRFLDGPLSPSSQDYVARGIVDGMGDASAPKTNIGRVGSGLVGGDLQYTGPTGILPDLRPLDSLVTMSWDPYPGAAGYWIHIYQLTNQG